ncbi:hypothetical protein MAPG_07678 [Magnaporthiopsis poae ATCC 64411]|uniref:MARVEL domain-containing protein n=1 Tax=Magnaporthiopsis poae (strain ATCC 64411 / 73-15) TaxID=644358 RepID=A0A0C4E5B2_MAGP6|nr:hypothetical protein MAPG_07678 [Magnaporthiopsis poae ATCC 64411]
MEFGIITILHIVAIVLCIIELGLTAYGVSLYTTPWGSWSPDRLNFMLFNSIWSLLVLAYLGLTPLFMPRLFHRMVALGALAVTVIFWFAGSIALAVLLGVPHACSASAACGSIQAAVAFGFFLWAIFTALLVMEVLAFSRSRSSATADQHSPHAKTQPYTGA